MAVRPGVVGSAGPVPGESGRIGLVALVSESCTTGRIVAPLKSGELDADLGERGVKGVGPSELWSPGVTGDETFSFFDLVLHELRSRLGTVEVRFDMLGGNWTRSRMNVKVRGVEILWVLYPVTASDEYELVFGLLGMYLVSAESQVTYAAERLVRVSMLEV